MLFMFIIYVLKRMIKAHAKDATATIVNRYVIVTGYFFSSIWINLLNNLFDLISLEEIAKKKNAKMAQVAIAWVMARDGKC